MVRFLEDRGLLHCSHERACGVWRRQRQHECGADRRPAAWAKDICVALNALIQPAKSGSANAESGCGGDERPKKSGRTSARFLGDLADLTEQTRAEFRAAGQPAVEKRQEVSAALNKNVENASRLRGQQRRCGEALGRGRCSVWRPGTLLAQGRKNASKASMRGCKADS